MTWPERLALGTAQFGLSYGVANSSGRVSLDEAAAILTVARDAGVDTLDTAPGYGDSESRLGQIGVTDWRVVSKLPEFPESAGDVGAWVESAVVDSLERLGVEQLEGLLLHRPRQLEGARGDELQDALIAVRASGAARHIGVSVYGPAVLDAVWVKEFDMVQAPFSVVDRSLVASGWLAQLTGGDTEIHTRSAFLQGLLLMADRPPAFDRWSVLFSQWEDWLETHSIAPVAACLRFVLAHQSIARVVVGVDTAVQLRDILDMVDEPLPPLPDAVASEDPNLIDPSRWTTQ